MKFDKWQEEILEAKGNICLCTGRQVGKTTILSEKAARRLIEKKSQIVVISLTEDQAKLIIVMVLAALERLKPSIIKQGKDRPTSGTIKLHNGSKIVSRPVGITGNSVRGFTGDVLIIDEASRMSESVFSAAKPVLLTTAGEIWMCSTPYGKQGYFYECFCNKDRFHVFHISSVEVIKSREICESWTEQKREAAISFIENEEKDMTKTRFGQEYLGLFIDDLQQFFPDNLITRCMRRKRPERISPKQHYYLGVDVARMGEDESTFEIIQMSEGRLIHVENQITKKTLLSHTSNHILELNKRYNFQKIFIDSEGIGVGVYDNLLDDDATKRKIIPILNSKRVLDRDEKQKVGILKEALYSNMLNLMERGKLELLDDPEVFQSLKSVQYEYTQDNLGRPHLKIYGNYTHITEGLIRACWCVKYKSLNIWIDSI